MTTELLPPPANDQQAALGLRASPCWAPSFSFYDAVCRQGIDPVTVRYHLPADLMRILVLLKKGWRMGHNWKVLNPNGQVSRFNAVSFHGPKGEFQNHPPADVITMTREQMVDFLFSRERRNN